MSSPILPSLSDLLITTPSILKKEKEEMDTLVITSSTTSTVSCTPNTKLEKPLRLNSLNLYKKEVIDVDNFDFDEEEEEEVKINKRLISRRKGLIVCSDEEDDDQVNRTSRPKLSKKSIILDSDEEEDKIEFISNSLSPIDLDNENESDYLTLHRSDSLLDINLELELSFLTYLEYFNVATAEELKHITLFTNEMIDMVLPLRPFKSLQDLNSRLSKKNKVKAKKMFGKFDDLLLAFQAVNRLLIKCNKFIGKFDNKVPYIIKEKEWIKNPTFINPKIQLKPYQKVGVNWLLSMFFNQCGIILADEMGLGKTCQVIVMLGKLNQVGVKGPHLVVVPSSVVNNWVNEFKKFCPKLRVFVYQGDQKERNQFQIRYQMGKLQEFDVMITSYNTATSNKYDRKFLKNLNFTSLILDEAHQVKNPNTQNHQYLLRIPFKFRLLLTGTPMQNNLKELINLLVFINPDLFGDSHEDLNTLFNCGLIKSSHFIQENMSQLSNNLSNIVISKIKHMFFPFLLQREKSKVLTDLANKVQHIAHCPMSSTQQRLYDNALEMALQDKTLGKVQLSNISFKLRRIANHTMLAPGGYHYSLKVRANIAKDILREREFHDSDYSQVKLELEEYCDSDIQELCLKYPSINKYILKNKEWMESGKAIWLAQNLPKMIKKGDRMLIFSQFTMVLDILESVMNSLDIQYFRMDGNTEIESRQPQIDEFNSNEDIKVFFLSTKTGGCGINLTGANVVILHDIDHNPQNDRQAEARAHRVGQVKEVNVYRLISKSTIEERTLDIGTKKLKLTDSLSGDARQLSELVKDINDSSEQDHRIKNLYDKLFENHE